MYDKLKNYLSEERLKSYLEYIKNKDNINKETIDSNINKKINDSNININKEAIELYELNIKISNAFNYPLEIFEVILRNSINNVLLNIMVMNGIKNLL